MRLPRLIYEIYPAAYILTGITTMSLSSSIVAFYCGLILSFSGTLILFLRRNYRSVRQRFFTQPNI